MRVYDFMTCGRTDFGTGMERYSSLETVIPPGIIEGMRSTSGFMGRSISGRSQRLFHWTHLALRTAEQDQRYFFDG
jgi:hypothetical protein